MTHWTDRLVALGETGERPCAPAVEWARGYDSLEAAWAACERGDWMLWLAGRLAGPPWAASRRPLVRACALCAELALPYVRDEWAAGLALPYVRDEWAAGVTLATIQTAHAWSEGEASEEEVRDAAYAADAAACAAACAAAYADADAADAAYTAADAACADGYAADAAYAAAAYAAAYDAAAANAACTRVLAQCADIVRDNLPCPVLP